MRRWAAAFEQWLAEQRAEFSPSSHKQAALAWRRLLRQQGKLPWELETADLEAHAAWMEAEGFSPATIANGLGYMAKFYRWCEERKIDPACGEGFNPAEKARRPAVGRYRGAQALSGEEVDRLLATTRRDRSELGRRDYAFTLTRLLTGVPLRNLQPLKWGQIEPDGEGAWVRWRPEGERRRHGCVVRGKSRLRSAPVRGRGNRLHHELPVLLEQVPRGNLPVDSSTGRARRADPPRLT